MRPTDLHPHVDVTVEPGLFEVHHVRGARAGDRPPSLLLELPHGATRAEHYAACRARLKSPLPERLEHFFFVNTDVGSFAVARALAVELARRWPDLSVVLLRSQIPRTFVDCNRLIDGPTDTGLTPGIPPYVTDPADLAALRAMHRAYTDRAAALFDATCGAGGLALMVHTYAPRTVPIEVVDAHIVENLHAVYDPAVVDTHPLRPEIDFIVRPPSGASPAAMALVDDMAAAWRAAGFAPTIDGTWPLHPVTMAHRFAMAHPGRTVCFEIRRDLIVERFTPFAEMTPDPARVRALVEPVASAIAAHMTP